MVLQYTLSECTAQNLLEFREKPRFVHGAQRLTQFACNQVWGTIPSLLLAFPSLRLNSLDLSLNSLNSLDFIFVNHSFLHTNT